jgi:exodeoxyribonuclease-3
LMRIVTWNINSLRARQERVEAWLEEVQPDVVLLQETKMTDDAFPTLAFEALGYTCAHHGQGQWNGVAILSKVGLKTSYRTSPVTATPTPMHASSLLRVVAFA